jgi:phage baseplate assembly protein W
VAKEILGTDLRLSRTELGWDLTVTGGGDLETVSNEDNLVQALTLRLNTPRGQLAGLGHPDYGSRLPELIGRPNDVTTRNLVKFYTLECVRQEPRIQEVLDVKVETTPEQGRVSVHLRVLPMGENAPLNLVFPFHLEM